MPITINLTHSFSPYPAKLGHFQSHGDTIATSRDERKLMIHLGIKEYSDWPTIPQLYVEKEFIGGCDILTSMHQNGELAKLLEEKNVLAKEE